MTEPIIHGQPEGWSETNEGHRTVYKMDPALIPAAECERVIYELRLDVIRLNDEAMEYHRRLTEVPEVPQTDEDFAALPILDLSEYHDEDARRGDR